MDFLKSKSKIFLSILVSFIIGVAIYLWWKPDIRFSASVTVIICASVLLIIISILWRKDIYIRLSSLVFTFIFLGFAFSFTYFHFSLVDPLNSEKIETNFVGYICNDPEVGMEVSKYEICLLKLDEKKADFKILMTNDLYPQYKIGEVISGKGNLERPGMIDGFDYQNYLLTKKIFAVIYKPKIKNNNIKFIQPNDIGTNKFYLLKIREILFSVKNKFEGTINQIMAEPEASFLNGLILGEKSGMSKELIDNFNKTGTTHIIALSGFNVTIIIFAVATLFGYLGKRNAFFISL
ncbi:MAG: ComEC/Rec2 family competence protein, partial [Candidatus Berkelbacteria bacterium]|nr:ComEC/Rec2 family competence protein [Candidatus Berkelbacteria bacterium]